jgi:hypothetical protein
MVPNKRPRRENNRNRILGKQQQRKSKKVAFKIQWSACPSIKHTTPEIVSTKGTQ